MYNEATRIHNSSYPGILIYFYSKLQNAVLERQKKLSTMILANPAPLFATLPMIYHVSFWLMISIKHSVYDINVTNLFSAMQG